MTLPALLDDVAEGTDVLLDAYAGVRQDDFVLVAYTSDSRESVACIMLALRHRSIDAVAVCMLPLVDATLRDRLHRAIPANLAADRRLIVLTLERDTMSHTDALRQLVKSYPCGRTIVVRAMGASPELFAIALRVSPQELSRRNAVLLSRLTRATTLRIVTDRGTDLTVTLDQSRFRWISNRGIARPGAFVVVPAGEVATYPATINGRLVADFALHINCVTARDCRLSDRPVTVEIEDGSAVRVETRDKDLERYLVDQMAVPSGRRVGELGFGTNPRVSTPLAHNSHINERCPGVHVGFGQHNQDDALNYACDVHLDLIARGGRIWIDDSAEPIDLDALASDPAEHPTGLPEEDVFAPNSTLADGDCCGLD